MTNRFQLHPLIVLFWICGALTYVESPACIANSEGTDSEGIESLDCVVSSDRFDNSDCFEDPSFFDDPRQHGSFSFPESSEHLLLDWRSCTKFWSTEDVATKLLITSCKTLKLFGDGTAASEEWDLGNQPLLSRQELEELLISLEPWISQTENRDEDLLAEQGFLRLHLDHYATAHPEYQPRWLVDIRLVDEEIPRVIRDELSMLRSWLRRVWQLEHRRLPLFVSGNPYPKICQPEYRRQAGLRVLQPAWCEGKIEPERTATDEEARIRLRERLRTLPRGTFHAPNPEDDSGTQL